VANEYASLEELKAAMGPTNAPHDVLLQAALTAASRWIDNSYCHRRFYTTEADETRLFTASRSDRLLFPVDLLSLTALETDDAGDRTYGTTWAATDYDLLPANAPLDGEPYWEIAVAPNGARSFPTVPLGVRLTGKFGFCELAHVPDAVKQACILRAVQFFNLPKAPFGPLGLATESTMTSMPLSGAYAVIKDLLDPYRVLRVG
jgi:hypothetical protein